MSGYQSVDFRSQQGFSLVELLIVVAIIGILAAIAIPKFAAYRAKAYNTSARSDLYNLRSMMESAAHDQGKYPRVE